SRSLPARMRGQRARPLGRGSRVRGWRGSRIAYSPAVSRRVFLLSPAICSGERARMLLRREARFDLARRLQGPEGAPLGEVFSFLSGLYFRGKLAYARRFAAPADEPSGVLVITPCSGLRPAALPVRAAVMRRFARVDIDVSDARYRTPVHRYARQLAALAGPDAET